MIMSLEDDLQRHYDLMQQIAEIDEADDRRKNLIRFAATYLVAIKALDSGPPKEVTFMAEKHHRELSKMKEKYDSELKKKATRINLLVRTNIGLKEKLRALPKVPPVVEDGLDADFTKRKTLRFDVEDETMVSELELEPLLRRLLVADVSTLTINKPLDEDFTSANSTLNTTKSRKVSKIKFNRSLKHGLDDDDEVNNYEDERYENDKGGRQLSILEPLPKRVRREFKIGLLRTPSPGLGK